VLQYAIPDDSFTDPEDGDTSNLQLLFQTFDDELSVAPSSWIQLNQTSRTLYGLPLSQDSGTHRYKLVYFNGKYKNQSTNQGLEQGRRRFFERVGQL